MNDKIRIKLSEILLQKLREDKGYLKKYPVFRQDINVWQNKDFETFALEILEIETSTLKRIFKVKGFQQTSGLLTKGENPQKLARYLGFDTWEALENYLIERLILEKSTSAQFAEIKEKLDKIESLLKHKK